MPGQQSCTSLFYEPTDDDAIFDTLNSSMILKNIVEKSYVYSYKFILYGGPILVFLNMLAIFILTRKELRTSYNVVFIAMAIDQVLAILGRAILLWVYVLEGDLDFHYTLAWKIFELFVVNSGPIFSAHVSWLAVILTIVRLRYLRANLREPTIRCMITLCCSSLVIVLAASAPTFLTVEIFWLEVPVDCESEVYTIVSIPQIRKSAMTYAHDCLLLRVTYFIRGVLFKAIPCILLISLSSALLFRMKNLRKTHCGTVAGQSAAASSDSSRTSWMIAMIVFTTLLSDVPQAAVSIMAGFMSDQIRDAIAYMLEFLMVSIIMASSVANLAIHLCMSKRFRQV